MPTALITGASSGIGLELASRGARATGTTSSSSPETASASTRSAAASTEEFGVRVVGPREGPPRSRRRRRRSGASSPKRGIVVDVLVNNAGFGLYGFFAKTPLDRELEMIQVNVAALTHLTKVFLPGMLERRRGRILNVASTAAFQPGPIMAVYYATKAYVLSFSEALANETAGTGVTVTALCPGTTSTEFQQRAGIGRMPLVRAPLVSDAADVAREGWDAMKRGKRVVIPGIANRVLVQAERITPRRLVTAIARKLQESRRMKEADRMIRARRTLVALVALGILSILAAAPPLSAADPAPPLAQNPEVAAAVEVFDAWADWTAKNRDQPAVSIGIVYDQQLVFAKGYGYADLGRKIPATPATAYRIASISKTFTAHALLQLRDAGKLQLDDPITKWIPELKLAKVDPQSPAITIRQLLTHTAGIPREVDGTYWNDMNFPSREAMLPVLNRMGVVLPPETEWKYSNVALSPRGLHRRGRLRRALRGVHRAPRPGAPRHDRHARDSSDRHADPRGRLRPAHARQAAPRRAVLQRRLHGPRVEPRVDRRRPREVRLAPVPHAARPAAHRFSRARRSPRCSGSSGSSPTGRAAGASAGASRAATTSRASATAAPCPATARRSPSRRPRSSPSSRSRTPRTGGPASTSTRPTPSSSPRSRRRPPPRRRSRRPTPAWNKYVGVYTWEDEEIHVAILDGRLTMFDPSEDNPWESKVVLEPVSGNVFRQKGGDATGETVTFILDPAGKVIRYEAPGYYMSRRP